MKKNRERIKNEMKEFAKAWKPNEIKIQGIPKRIVRQYAQYDAGKIEYPIQPILFIGRQAPWPIGFFNLTPQDLDIPIGTTKVTYAKGSYDIGPHFFPYFVHFEFSGDKYVHLQPRCIPPLANVVELDADSIPVQKIREGAVDVSIEMEIGGRKFFMPILITFLDGGSDEDCTF
jgi:hypothetical protein